MVLEIARHGLIVTTGALTTESLDELVAHCDWPLVLAATPSQLQRDLSIHDPQCVLFWTESQQSIAPTARLIAWLRERGNRPYRLAFAHNLGEDVEPLLRGAGAHCCWVVSGDVLSAARQVLKPWLESPATMLRSHGAPDANAVVRQPASSSELLDPLRPP